MCPWTCLLWMCDLLPFHLISSLPLAVDQTNSKTTANMGLLNGFPFCFLLLLCLPPFSFLFFSCSYLPPFFYFSLSLSIFLFFLYCALAGVQDEVCEKKPKVFSDTSGLVPYGGDSSDEEEERSRSSKTDNS